MCLRKKLEDGQGIRLSLTDQKFIPCFTVSNGDAGTRLIQRFLEVASALGDWNTAIVFI